MTPLVEWAGGTMIAATLLMVLVLAARGPAVRMFGGRIGYALWLLPAARMLLPPLPDWTGFGMRFAPPYRIAIMPVDRMPPAVPAMPGAAASGGVIGAGIEWGFWLVALWVAGAVVHFGWHMLVYRRFLRRSLGGAVLLTRAARISVLSCPAVPSPMAAGVLHRRILLPTDFVERFTPEERRLALAHETAHHCRGDLWANLFALALLSLHWFNPIAHRAYRAFREDQEAACDATVLDAERPDRAYAYGSAILKSASCRAPGAACAFNHAGSLKRRFTIMTRGKTSLAARIGGGGLVLALLASGLAGTASTLAATRDGDRHTSLHVERTKGGPARVTVFENGRVRNATAAERRQAQRSLAQADRALADADRAMRRAGMAVPPVPAAPTAPSFPDIADLPPIPPLPPLPPVPAVDGQVSIDQVRVRAEVRTAMTEAATAIESARISAEEGRRIGAMARRQARADIRHALAQSDISRRAAQEALASLRD